MGQSLDRITRSTFGSVHGPIDEPLHGTTYGLMHGADPWADQLAGAQAIQSGVAYTVHGPIRWSMHRPVHGGSKVGLPSRCTGRCMGSPKRGCLYDAQANARAIQSGGCLHDARVDPRRGLWMPT